MLDDELTGYIEPTPCRHDACPDCNGRMIVWNNPQVPDECFHMFPCYCPKCNIKVRKILYPNEHTT